MIGSDQEVRRVVAAGAVESPAPEDRMLALAVMAAAEVEPLVHPSPQTAWAALGGVGYRWP